MIACLSLPPSAALRSRLPLCVPCPLFLPGASALLYRFLIALITDALWIRSIGNSKAEHAVPASDAPGGQWLGRCSWRDHLGFQGIGELSHFATLFPRVGKCRSPVPAVRRCQRPEPDRCDPLNAQEGAIGAPMPGFCGLGMVAPLPAAVAGSTKAGLHPGSCRQLSSLPAYEFQVNQGHDFPQVRLKVSAMHLMQRVEWGNGRRHSRRGVVSSSTCNAQVHLYTCSAVAFLGVPCKPGHNLAARRVMLSQ